MTTVLLLRHGLTSMTGPVLAGWTPDVHLDERGRAQAAAVARALAEVPLRAVVASPLERCVETAGAVAAGRTGEAGRVVVEERLGECRYGDWTGRPLAGLREDPLWPVVQAHPSAAVFPGAQGEPMAAVSARAVRAVREQGERLALAYGEDAVWLACSHGDVIKAVLADALGMHLDLFQRIVVDPCSVSVVRYDSLRPSVLLLNGSATGLPGLVRGDAAAAVGGGAGGG